LNSERNNEPVNVTGFPDASYYGLAYDQIRMNNGDLLHEAGFRGEGMTIAVIDASFTNVDKIDFFNPDQILGYRNFTHQKRLSSENEDEGHGTKVLSCMFANKPGYMVGTAPEASYYLIRTEVLGEEYAEEEDYWIAGIEYADSLGVDVVSSSLGYTDYDASSMSYFQSQLDGKTALISRAASMASKKGILLFVSAGNDRDKTWQKISFPADAENVITVGSVDSEKEIAYFSSLGYTEDKRIKPDLLAKGINVSVVYPSGNVFSFVNGTSFSTPILAGLGACLWQALPDLTNLQIIDLLRKNADRFHQPDSLYGYGIPDVYKAYQRTIPAGINPVEKDPSVFYYDSSGKLLYVNLSVTECIGSKLRIFSVLGNLVLQRKSLTGPVNVGFLTKGIYIAKLEVKGKQYIRKFIKF
jgi:subtilisin family serine protease